VTIIPWQTKEVEMIIKWILSQKYFNSKKLTKTDLSPCIVNILFNRGYTSLISILDFLRPSLFDLYSPFLFKDMKKIVNRLENALKNGDKILLYGDYDADGISGTSLLYKVLKRFGFNVFVYIPTRDEGYGLHEEVVNKAANNGIKLIVTIDCGITAIEEVLLASSYQMDTIITDHHEPLSELPNALGILNPKIKDSGYPFRDLAGVGVVFKLIQALYKHFNYPRDLGTELDYLDIVALGTIADIVPLVGENRILVKYGLQLMSETKHAGIRALLRECGLEGKDIKCGHISYYVAPRINAPGRMDTAHLALNLFLEEDYEQALQLAKQLSNENRQRQMAEAEILKDAENMLSTAPVPEVIVLSSPNWNHGVIGIVASRLVERYQRPVFLIAEEKDLGKGSARGVSNYNVIEELTKHSTLLTKYGGHKQAAGFTIPIKNIKLFREGLIKSFRESGVLFQKNYLIDSVVSLDQLSFELQSELDQMAPFGLCNPAPILLTEGLLIKNIFTMGKDNEHLKLILEENNYAIEAVAFKKGEEFEKLKQIKKIDILYTLEFNVFHGNQKLQANIIDYRESNSYSLSEIACTEEYQLDGFSGELCLKNIFINRDILVELYKLLKKRINKDNILIWEPDLNNHNLLHMIKIFEELGIITWLAGTGPFILRLNAIKKTDLDRSLRFRVLSKK